MEEKKMNVDNLISLTEYAALHKVNPSSVRRKILRGNLPAKKIGRNWLIEKEQPYTDHRRKK